MADSPSFSGVFQLFGKTVSRGWKVGVVAFLIAISVLLPAEYSLHHLEEHCGELARNLAALKPDLLKNPTAQPKVENCDTSLVPFIATVRDVGIGLVVSVFAALLYEVAVHGLGLAQKSADLSTNIETLNSLVSASKASDETTFQSLLHKHINGLEPALCRPLAKLLAEVQEMSTAKDSEHYTRFFAWYLDKAATRPATSLRRMLAVGGQDQFEYEPVDDAELSLKILSAQMKYMTKGCSYDSFASLRLYESPHHQLYVTETRAALLRGMKVRRIYNVISLQKTIASGQQGRRADHYLALLEQQRRELGPEHYESGQIEARFFTQTDAAKCRDRLAYMLQATRVRRDLEELFFGRFQFGEQGDLVRVFVAHSPTGNVSVAPGLTAEAWAGIFNELWDCSSRVSPFTSSSHLNAGKAQPPRGDA